MGKLADLDVRIEGMTSEWCRRAALEGCRLSVLEAQMNGDDWPVDDDSVAPSHVTGGGTPHPTCRCCKPVA